MKRAFLLLSFLLPAMLGATPLPAQTGGTDFGQELTIDTSQAVDLSTAIASPELYGTTILLRGTVEDVCRKKGCWVVVSDGKHRMRITFKDYGFFLPTDCSGRRALLEGVVSEQEISEELAKHYAEESAGEDPDAIDGPQTVVTMVATGVRLEE